MKVRIIAFLLFVLPGLLVAQDYRCVNPSGVTFFEKVTVTSQTLLDNSSPIKAVRIDSVSSASNKSEMYSFSTYRDTSFNTNPFPCILKDGPCWLGWKIIEYPDETIFLNLYNDSIRLRTTDTTGSEWIFFELGIANVWATVDSVYFKQHAGYTDSVKHISLEVRDSNGIVIGNTLNGMYIEVSRSHGFFRTMEFWNFPAEQVIMERIESVDLPSVGDIYNFNVNDEFEYLYTVNNGYHSYTHLKVLNVNVDSVSDHGEYILQLNSLIYNMGTFYVSLTDTVIYSNISSLFYPGVPEENNFDSVYNTLNYQIRHEADTVHDIYVYTQKSGFTSMDPDSCFHANYFEPDFIINEYSPGLGLLYSENNSLFSTGIQTTNELIWYKKGNTVWGNYVVVANLNDLSYSSRIAIYPNPVRQFFRVDLREIALVSIYDFAGRLVYNLKPDETGLFDTSNINAGFYTVKAASGKNVFTGSLIKL